MSNKFLFWILGVIVVVGIFTIFIKVNMSVDSPRNDGMTKIESEVTSPVLQTNPSETEISTESIVDKQMIDEPVKFQDKNMSTTPEQVITSSTKLALLANGCFWCVESDLEKVAGIKNVVSGYAGGTTENPTYDNYVAGGHREVVQVIYDPSVISFANLVEHIIKHGDPTDDLGSFNDRGLPYAPAIYYENDSEKSEALRVIAAVDEMKVFEDPLPLSVIPAVKFWPAEEYHQDYAKKNPLRYGYYRRGSGRTAFIEKTWGDRLAKFEVPTLANSKDKENNSESLPTSTFNAMSWQSFIKPSEEILKETLTPLQYKVTQEEGTESPFKNVYDKNYTEGIYVDIVSGEPLYFSKDKYDSGTGWPSFVKPISDDVVTLKTDKSLFSTRTEVRSRYADSHVGHVFNDGPADRGGKRYCMNSAALRFVAKEDMESEGYGYLLKEM